MKPDILFLEDSSTVLPVIPLLERHFAVHRLAEGAGPAAVAPALVPRIRGLVTTTNRGVEAALIEALPALEAISVSGNHLHHVPLDLLRRRGIRLGNTPSISKEDVADLVIGLILLAARRIAEGDRFVRAGRWLQGGLPFGVKVSGKAIGIVGLGKIGREVARRAEAFAMTVHYNEPAQLPDVPYRHHARLLDMARAVDILAVTCPSAPETRHIINREVLAALGPGGVLANVVKGCVDEEALVTALRAGTIAGAGLDVFDGEPRIRQAFHELDNVVLSPHIAWKSTYTQERLAEITAENLRAHFAGEPLVSPVL